MKTCVNIIIVLFVLLCFTNSRAGTIEIKDWLITGSFTNDKATELLHYAFLDEANVAPTAGESAGEFKWQKISAHNVDFMKYGFKKTDNCVAYAFTYIYSETEQLAGIGLGSDDGVCVWLNGIKVWDNPAMRGLQENEDNFTVQLSKGWNRLLVKVSQGSGDWGMICNLRVGSVKLSVERPAVNELAKGDNVAVSGLNVGNISNKTVNLDIKINNFGHTNAENIKCGVAEADGNPIAASMFQEILANSERDALIQISIQTFSKLLSNNDAKLFIEYDNTKKVIAISSETTLDLIMKVAMDKDLCNTETQKAAKEINNLRTIYGSNDDLSSYSRQAAAYIANYKFSEISSVLDKMKKSILKNIPDMSNDTIQVVGHAHMDQNWLWPYTETIKMTHDNFRQVIAFMEKFPDYTMLQSQVAIYKQTQKVDPPLFEKIQKYVKEGRLEPVGGMWVEGDCNMTGGEALTRSFLLGQHFFNDNLGRIAHVGWLPDDFGHISQFPQILKLAGCDYFFFMRCRPYFGTFWWIGPDSSKVLCYSNDNYNGEISPSLKDDIKKYSPKKGRLLAITGVGDHGGGPTLENIEMVHKLDSTPHYPAVKFTTAENFFKKSLKEMDGRPTHRGEMQYIFEGCYTSVAEIKENTRKSEQSMYKTEFLSSLRWLYGDTYPASELRSLWETVNFNEFHDILPGSAIYETFQDAIADHKYVQKQLRELFEFAFRKMSDEITFKQGLGQPIVAVNMQPHGRKALVEAEIFTYDAPLTAQLSHWGDFYGYNDVTPTKGYNAPTLLVCDASGKTYPAQITGGKLFPPGYRSQILFVADNMPAGGYKAFYADPSKPAEDNFSKVSNFGKDNDGVFETDYFIITFDMKTGEIIKLKDKRTDKDYVSDNGHLNRLKIYMEAPNDMNAWTIGEIKSVQDITDIESVKITERGPVRACVEAVKKWGRSKFIQKTYIYKSYPRIDFSLDVHWFEVADGIANAPFLKTTFDLAYDNPEFINHTPFDAVKRPTNGQEVPAQQWVDVSDGKTGIALLNRTKFGHSFDKGQLRLSLLRATYSPNMYPNIGVNHIQYSLYPHSGDWKNGVWAEADNFNIPVYAAEPPSLALVKTHATKPQEDSLIIVNPPEIVMSGIKQSEDGNELIIRLEEVNGKETTATVTIPVTASSARRLNILEYPLESVDKPVVNGRKITVKIKPHEIVTLGIKTKSN